MNWLRRLFGKNKEPAKTEVLEPFPPIDKAHIRNTTRLIEQAETDGANEYPASMSSDKSLTEQTIRKKCEERQSEYIKNYGDRQRRNLSRLYKIHESWSVDTVQNKLKEMINGVIADGKAAFGPIDTSANDLKSLAADLRHFRYEHGLLNRAPVYQDIWHYRFFLLIAFLIELVITVFLLRESGGLLMVLILSIIYCFLNCWVPILVANKLGGRSISYRWKQYPYKKLIGWIVTIITIIVLGGGLNLLMGHYRSAALELTTIDYQQYDLESLTEITEQITSIGFTALDNFLVSPFGINDVWSWLLAIAGYFIFLFGFMEGFVKDDHYPDYGEKARRYKTQREKHDADIFELIEKLKKQQKYGVETIENEKRKLRDNFARDPELRSNIQAFEGQCERACQSLNNDYQELINQYRQINIETRKTPAPHYFQHEPQLSLMKIPAFEIPSEDTANRKNLLIRQLSESTSILHKQFEKLINNIKPSQEIITLDPLAIRITE